MRLLALRRMQGIAAAAMPLSVARGAHGRRLRTRRPSSSVKRQRTRCSSGSVASRRFASAGCCTTHTAPAVSSNELPPPGSVSQRHTAAGRSQEVQIALFGLAAAPAGLPSIAGWPDGTWRVYESTPTAVSSLIGSLALRSLAVVSPRQLLTEGAAAQCWREEAALCCDGCRLGAAAARMVPPTPRRRAARAARCCCCARHSPPPGAQQPAPCLPAAPAGGGAQPSALS